MLIQYLKKNYIQIGFIIFVSLVISIFGGRFINGSPFAQYSKFPFIDAFYIILVIFFSAWLIIYKSYKYGKRILYYLLAALFIRYVIVFSMSFYGIIPYAYDLGWHHISINLIKEWNNGIHFGFQSSWNVRYYTIITAIVYFIFQANPIYMQLMNVLFSVATIIYIYKLAKFLFSREVAVKTTMMISFWPSFVFVSSMHMRESLATFFMIGFLYYFILWYNSTNKSNKNAILATFFLLGVILMRQQNGILFPGIISPFIIYRKTRNSTKHFRVFTFLFFIGTFTLIFYVLSRSSLSKFLDIRYIINEMDYRTSGSAVYLEWMEYTSIYDIIKYSLLRLIYFFYTPFLWQVKNPFQILAFLESLGLIFMSFSIVKKREIYLKSKKKKEILFIMIFIFIGLLANGIIDSNIGTAMRHKLQFVPLVIMLYFAGSLEFRDKLSL